MAKKAKTTRSQSDIHNVDPPDEDDIDDVETSDEESPPAPPAPPKTTEEQKAGEPVPPPAGSPTTVTIRADGTVVQSGTPPEATEK